MVRTQERREANDEEKTRVNREAGNILELANKFAEEANKFVMNSGETKVDSTDKENYSPEARMFFLQLKWYMFWSGAAYDLRLRSWAREGGDGSRFSELEEQGGNSIEQKPLGRLIRHFSGPFFTLFHFDSIALALALSVYTKVYTSFSI